MIMQLVNLSYFFSVFSVIGMTKCYAYLSAITKRKYDVGGIFSSFPTFLAFASAICSNSESEEQSASKHISQCGATEEH